MGTPMEITDRCEIAHLLGGRVAELVPLGADAFAAAIQRLVTGREGYDRYRANRAEMVAENFSIKAVVGRLERVYGRVIAEKGNQTSDQAST
jgi:glycosyltransferase involved in cell wall biosynthesis